MMDYRIKWDGESHPGLEPGLRRELREIIGDNPEDLVFHVWIISEDIFGPSVECTWDAEQEVIVATYSAVTKWVNLNEQEDE